jgi:DNA-binding transcriptional LysR family regulator
MLRGGDCDVVLAFRYEEEGWADMVVHPLLTDPLVAVLSEAHPLAREPVLADLTALADERWIAGCPRCRRHLVELCERTGFTPRIDFATDDYPAVIGLVASGLGVTVLPSLALEAVRTRGVRLLPLTPGVAREVVALTLPDLANVPAVDLMLGRLVRAARCRGG